MAEWVRGIERESSLVHSSLDNSSQTTKSAILSIFSRYMLWIRSSAAGSLICILTWNASTERWGLIYSATMPCSKPVSKTGTFFGVVFVSNILHINASGLLFIYTKGIASYPCICEYLTECSKRFLHMCGEIPSTLAGSFVILSQENPSP